MAFCGCIWCRARRGGEDAIVAERPARLPELESVFRAELEDMSQRAAQIGMALPPWRGPDWDVTGWIVNDRSRAHQTPQRENALVRRFHLMLRLWRGAKGVYYWPYEVLDASEDGKLYRVHTDGPVIQFLLVTCPSMHKPHVLFVPTTMTSAKAARAWTFGMSEEEFSVGAET
jgi:hypothetical protein